MSADGAASDGQAGQIDAPGKAEMTIGGRRFVVGCAPGQEDRLKELGRRFDARVQELVEAMGDLGAERLFLMASLTLMDEAEGRAYPAPAAPAASDPQAEKRIAEAIRQEALAEAHRATAEQLAAIERRAADALAEAARRIATLSARIEDFE